MGLCIKENVKFTNPAAGEYSDEKKDTVFYNLPFWIFQVVTEAMTHVETGEYSDEKKEHCFIILLSYIPGCNRSNDSSCGKRFVVQNKD